MRLGSLSAAGLPGILAVLLDLSRRLGIRDTFYAAYHHCVSRVMPCVTDGDHGPTSAKVPNRVSVVFPLSRRNLFISRLRLST